MATKKKVKKVVKQYAYMTSREYGRGGDGSVRRYKFDRKLLTEALALHALKKGEDRDDLVDDFGDKMYDKTTWDVVTALSMIAGAGPENSFCSDFNPSKQFAKKKRIAIEDEEFSFGVALTPDDANKAFIEADGNGDDYFVEV